MCRVILILCYSQWSWRERRWSSPEWRGHVTLAPKRCPRNKKKKNPNNIHNHTQMSRNSIVMSTFWDFHEALITKGWRWQIDLFAHQLGHIKVVASQSRLCVEDKQHPCLFRLRCHPLLFFLRVCHRLMTDPKPTSVGGRVCPQESVGSKC